MNINKKLARAKQWAGEKMGAEAKTGVSEEFAALEVEMQLRHEGLSLILLPLPIAFSHSSANADFTVARLYPRELGCLSWNPTNTL